MVVPFSVHWQALAKLYLLGEEVWTLGYTHALVREVAWLPRAFITKRGRSVSGLSLLHWRMRKRMPEGAWQRVPRGVAIEERRSGVATPASS